MRTLAGWCLEQVLQLGPTFIKLGQLFANRTDILPAEFTDVSSTCTDPDPQWQILSGLLSLNRQNHTGVHHPA